MTKFVIIIRNPKKDTTWEEEYDAEEYGVETIDDVNRVGKQIVDSFNETLRPFESPREFVKGDFRKDLDWFRKKYHRAIKLMEEGDDFLVISSKEEYWIPVYSLIRANEIAKDEWTEEDEQIYQKLINEKIISKRK